MTTDEQLRRDERVLELIAQANEKYDEAEALVSSIGVSANKDARVVRLLAEAEELVDQSSRVRGGHEA